jgi:hypothetical protein
MQSDSKLLSGFSWPIIFNKTQLLTEYESVTHPVENLKIETSGNLQLHDANTKLNKHKHNRSLKVAVQGPDYYGPPLLYSFIHSFMQVT